ncbi:MAG: glycosyltransferase family 4 protein [Phycisphaerae bacterium]|nr:glycosyltransferase family 4 protein [Phycisphaerae bacterium]
MKVAIVQEHVDTRRGGAETSTVEMARHLALLGLDISIICRGEKPAPFVDQNVTFLPVVVKGVSRAARTYRFVQGVHRLCRDERFDIVHAVTPCLSANVYQPRGGTYAETIRRSLALAPPLLRPLKWLGRRFNIRQRFLFRLEQLLLGKHQDRVYVAAVSDYVRRQVVAIRGFPPERVRVVFNGVDIAPLTAEERSQLRTAVRAEHGLDEQSPLVLLVAHNFKLKGLAELLRATAYSSSTGAGLSWIVIVAGRDSPRPYQRLARRLGIESSVRFVGTETPVRSWYAAADALAHPTWYDPCSRVVLEALSVGLPVVTTRYNGAAEVIEPGRHGVVLAELGDVAGLAAGIENALQSTLREACQADAPRLHEQLAMARHARELKSLYEDVQM